MSLQPYELDIIKQQLGVTLTRVGAEPYIEYVALFDQVVFPYLYDNSTTSSTSVVAGATTAITVAANPAAPNNASQLTFQVNGQAVVDVGTPQEIVYWAIISGTTFTATFANAHTAPFTIWPNGAEWAVRGILARIASIETQMFTLAPITAGIQQADEFIKLYASTKGVQRGATHDKFGSLVEQRMQARDDLSGAIGFPNLWRQKSQSYGPSRTELY